MYQIWTYLNVVYIYIYMCVCVILCNVYGCWSHAYVCIYSNKVCGSTKPISCLGSGCWFSFTGNCTSGKGMLAIQELCKLLPHGPRVVILLSVSGLPPNLNIFKPRVSTHGLTYGLYLASNHLGQRLIVGILWGVDIHPTSKGGAERSSWVTPNAENCKRGSQHSQHSQQLFNGWILTPTKMPMVSS